MENKKNIFLKFLSLAFFIFFFAVGSAQAVCPVCVVAVGTCVGLSRYLGVDDIISGVWIGGLLISIFVWLVNWLKQKNVNFFGRNFLIFFLFYGLSIGPLYYTEIIGHPLNEFWGMDKLVWGIFAGTFFFLLSVFIHEKLKIKNGGKSYFPFQKVVVPIVALGILSLAFYFLTC